MSMTIEPTKTDKNISLYQLMPPTRKVTWEKNVRSLKLYFIRISRLKFAKF